MYIYIYIYHSRYDDIQYGVYQSVSKWTNAFSIRTKCMMCLDGFPYSWTHYGPDIEGMKIVRHPWFLRNIPGMKVLCVGVGSRQWRE